ncbi:MAG TPA: hypothetical protein VHP37_22000 [Burkholderiales bacterium]|nr:hypothetical protein [Burkholderiales bacterium]
MATTNDQLLAEFEDLLRTTPNPATIRHFTDADLDWLGRLSAAVEAWNSSKAAVLAKLLDTLHQPGEARAAAAAYRQIMALLRQARHDLRMKTVGPLTVAVGEGMVFDYFDELRKTVEAAKEDAFFIDPYLDAEFVSKYLPHITPGTAIRLLAREKLSMLLPAVDAFAKQCAATVAVRSAAQFHDRYVIIDRAACYQSGASFKDGAKKAPTTLTQITDAFTAVLKTYEDIWASAKVER